MGRAGSAAHAGSTRPDTKCSEFCWPCVPLADELGWSCVPLADELGWSCVPLADELGWSCVPLADERCTAVVAESLHHVVPLTLPSHCTAQSPVPQQLSTAGFRLTLVQPNPRALLS